MMPCATRESCRQALKSSTDTPGKRRPPRWRMGGRSYASICRAHGTECRPAGRGLAGDVVSQLLDQELLLADGFLDEVANRDDADDVVVVIEDRQVAEMLFGHQRHALVEGSAG